MTTQELHLSKRNIVRFRVRKGAVYLFPEEVLWEDDNVHQLKARVKKYQDRGLLATCSPITQEKGGAAWCIVSMNPNPPFRFPYGAAAVALGMGALIGAGVMLWQSRLVWLTAIGVAAVAWFGSRLLTGHSAACAGLHCPGCRG